MKKRSAIATLAAAAVVALAMGMSAPAAEAKTIINIGIGGPGFFGWHHWNGRYCGWRNHRNKVWSRRYHRWVWVRERRRHCR